MGDTQTSTESRTGIELAGRYRVVAPISSGAMGAVYRAEDRHQREQVALKRLLDRRQAARFEIEARLLSHLRHPRVVRVTDYFQDETGQYLVMQLVDGIDLAEVLKRSGNPGLPLREAIEYVRQTCEALQYVHEQQVVHRDVKPGNLILSEDGIVLVDFGVARELNRQDPGTIGIGTPQFMAPEVFSGGAASPRSDVFSVAATLWTLIAGTPPVYTDPTTLSELVAQVPPELEQAIQAGLELVPERRFSSVAAFAKALGSPVAPSQGESLVSSVDRLDLPRTVMEAVVRTAAGIFEAAAASIALTDRTTGELVYDSAWGAGAREIAGVKLPADTGIASSVVASGEGEAVSECRSDPRFAAQVAARTRYVPHTMLVVPLVSSDRPIGALSILDRRDGNAYGVDDVARASLFAQLAVAALNATAPNKAPFAGASDA